MLLKKLFNRRSTTSIIPGDLNLRNFRFLGEEAESLGNRLDHARKCLAGAKSPWARNHWTKTVEQLIVQWRRLPILHDSEAKMSMIPRWTVDYDFYELAEEMPGSIGGRLYHQYIAKDPDLTWSWENNRAQRLAKAQ